MKSPGQRFAGDTQLARIAPRSTEGESTGLMRKVRSTRVLLAGRDVAAPELFSTELLSMAVCLAQELQCATPSQEGS